MVSPLIPSLHGTSSSVSSERDGGWGREPGICIGVDFGDVSKGYRPTLVPTPLSYSEKIRHMSITFVE